MVSIIVPIYNLEQYCSYCIKSLLAQTYENIEILLIDDGSKDRSLAICQEFAAQDPRIRVIHQENQGVSAARNRGLDEARGDYIMFVDGDDIVAPNIVDRLRGCMKDNISLTCCTHTRIRTLETSISSPTLAEATTPAREVLEQILRGQFDISACGKLFTKSRIGSVRFSHGRKHNEDKDFLFRYTINQNDSLILVCDDPLYGYYIRPMSVTTTPYSPALLDMITLAQDAVDLVHDRMPELVEPAKVNLLSARLKVMKCILRSGKPEDMEQYRILRTSVLQSGKPKMRYFSRSSIEYTFVRLGVPFHKLLVFFFYRLKK